MQTVVGLYKNFEDAQHVVSDLHNAGFPSDKISLITRDEKGEYSRHLEGGTKQNVGEGAAAGAGIGAVLGGLGGLLVGLGALAIPGIGPVLAAGPLAAALAGAGIGAVSGGLLGALIDLGVPEDHAEAYMKGVEQGGTLVVVNSDAQRADEALMIMNRHNPMDIELPMGQDMERDEFSSYSTDTYDQQGMRQGSFQQSQSAIPVTGSQADRDVDDLNDEEFTSRQHLEDDFSKDPRIHDESNIPVTGAHDMDIPVIEEEIRVGKREVEQGGIRVEKREEEIPFEQDVNLRQEQINVERRPVDREATDSDFQSFREGSMELTEKSEEPVVEKRARVTEEVHIDKDVRDKTEKIQDTLHKQDVDVTRTGGAAFDWNTFDREFRSHYQTRYGTSGYDYDYYMPAYRYGYGLGMDERYRNHDWNTMEQQARSDWERCGGQGAWEDIKDAVRHAWERVKR